VGEIIAFLDSVRGNTEPATVGWDGYKALEVAYAMHISNKENKEIQLPLAI
jgi:predicted dehydrogenase